MGKKRTKKIVWARLSLGGGSGTEDDAGSTTATPSAEPRSNFRRKDRKLVHTETHIFNDEEYTKIQTPRQDLLFKKGYLSRPKKSEASSEERACSEEGNIVLIDSQSVEDSYGEDEEAEEEEEVESMNSAEAPPQEGCYPDNGQVYMEQYCYVDPNGQYYTTDVPVAYMDNYGAAQAQHVYAMQGGPMVQQPSYVVTYPMQWATVRVQPMEWYPRPSSEAQYYYAMNNQPSSLQPPPHLPDNTSPVIAPEEVPSKEEKITTSTEQPQETTPPTSPTSQKPSRKSPTLCETTVCSESRRSPPKPCDCGPAYLYPGYAFGTSMNCTHGAVRVPDQSTSTAVEALPTSSPPLTPSEEKRKRKRKKRHKKKNSDKILLNPENFNESFEEVVKHTTQSEREDEAEYSNCLQESRAEETDQLMLESQQKLQLKESMETKQLLLESQQMLQMEESSRQHPDPDNEKDSAYEKSISSPETLELPELEDRHYDVHIEMEKEKGVEPDEGIEYGVQSDENGHTNSGLTETRSSPRPPHLSNSLPTMCSSLVDKSSSSSTEIQPVLPQDNPLDENETESTSDQALSSTTFDAEPYQESDEPVSSNCSVASDIIYDHLQVPSTSEVMEDQEQVPQDYEEQELDDNLLMFDEERTESLQEVRIQSRENRQVLLTQDTDSEPESSLLEEVVQESKINSEPESSFLEENTAQESKIDSKLQSSFLEENIFQETKINSEPESSFLKENTAQESKIDSELQSSFLEENIVQESKINFEPESSFLEENRAQESKIDFEQESSFLEEVTVLESKIDSEIEETASLPEVKITLEELPVPQEIRQMAEDLIKNVINKAATIVALNAKNYYQQEEKVSLISSSPSDNMSTVISSSPSEDMSTVISSSLSEDMSTVISSSPSEGMSAVVSSSPAEGMSTVVSSSPSIDMSTVIPSSPPEDMSTVISSSPSEGMSTVISISPSIDMSTVIPSSPPENKSTVISSSPSEGMSAVISISPSIDMSTVIPSSPPEDMSTVISSSPPEDMSTVISSSPSEDMSAVISSSTSEDMSTVISSSTLDDISIEISSSQSNEILCSLPEKEVTFPPEEKKETGSSSEAVESTMEELKSLSSKTGICLPPVKHACIPREESASPLLEGTSEETIPDATVCEDSTEASSLEKSVDRTEASQCAKDDTFHTAPCDLSFDPTTVPATPNNHQSSPRCSTPLSVDSNDAERPILTAVEKWLAQQSLEQTFNTNTSSLTEDLCESDEEENSVTHSKNVLVNSLLAPSSKCSVGASTVFHATAVGMDGVSERVGSSNSYQTSNILGLLNKAVSDEDQEMYSPMKYSKYYHLGMDIDEDCSSKSDDQIFDIDLDAKSPQDHSSLPALSSSELVSEEQQEQSPFKFTRPDSEIVVHTASDVASECGSEDVDLLAHRYDITPAATSSNKLSLATELLQQVDDPSYQTELLLIPSDQGLPVHHGNRAIFEQRYGSKPRPEIYDSGISSDDSGDEYYESFLKHRIQGISYRDVNPANSLIFRTLREEGPVPCGVCCVIQ